MRYPFFTRKQAHRPVQGAQRRCAGCRCGQYVKGAFARFQHGADVAALARAYMGGLHVGKGKNGQSKQEKDGGK